MFAVHDAEPGLGYYKALTQPPSPADVKFCFTQVTQVFKFNPRRRSRSLMAATYALIVKRVSTRKLSRLATLAKTCRTFVKDNAF